MNASATLRRIAVISTVHDTYDTRIFYKQVDSLRRHYQVTYLTPLQGASTEDWIVPLYKSRSKLGRLRTHLSLLGRLPAVKADLYLLHDPELLPLGILLAWCGKKVVWDMHEDTYHDIQTKHYLPRPARTLAAWAYRFFQSLAYRTCSGFLLAEDAYGKYFPQSRRVCVVHNYPMLERLNGVGELAQQRETLVYIGSISTNRGVYQLLEIVARLKDRIPSVRLLLIGPFTDEALERSVRARVRELGIEDRVEIRGPMKNIEAYPVVAQCGIGLALLLPEPNFTKSLPTKMFEYMALGLPVVVSDFPLWADIVNQHEAGAAVDSTNVEAAADAIYGLLADAQRYALCARNARAAAQQYSWETESRALQSFLQGILESHA